jgi:hypothetical protein
MKTFAAFILLLGLVAANVQDLDWDCEDDGYWPGPVSDLI